jgi:hypothetical protein
MPKALEEKLKREAKSKGLSKERQDAYVYGTLYEKGYQTHKKKKR